MRILRDCRVWGALIGLGVVLAAIYFLYLAAVISPRENMSDLPVALVNEDRGGEIAGEEVALGDDIVDRATDPDSPAGDVVEWTRFGSREEALEKLEDNQFYGAIVIPEDYTESLSDIAGPPKIPLALVNEDESANLGGHPVEFGEEVSARLTAPDSPAVGTVEWTRLEDRQSAIDGFAEGKYYAAVVIPPDYSERLVGMAAPPDGNTGGPTEAAELELLTNPQAKPSATGEIEAAFSGIVDSVSGATRGQILENVPQTGSGIPPQAVAAISDPVREKVVEVEVGGGVATLPAAPEAAEIEVLANPAAGQGGQIVEDISLGIVDGVSDATSERMSAVAGERGARLPPEAAAVIGDPVRAEVAEAVSLGENSGNGGMPFFLAFLGGLSGAIGATAIHVTSSLASGGSVSRAALWTFRVLLGLVFAAVFAGAEVSVAFGILDAHRAAGIFEIYSFLALAIAAILLVTLVLAKVFGYAGLILSLLLNVILGLVSSGGLAPIQALPGAYQAYAEWLPLRHAADGLRSLVFFDGRLAAGLESALWTLGAYVVGSILLGYAVALAQGIYARREGAAAESHPELQK